MVAVRRVFRIVAILLASRIATAAQAPTPAPKSAEPRLQVVARGEVVTKPRRVTRKGRSYLEFEITLSAYTIAPKQPPGADRSVTADMEGRVTVDHDLACNGSAPDLAVGDRIELSGEYVKSPAGDRIEFTNPTGSSKPCGKGSGRPDGYLREIMPVAPTPHEAVTPPRPAGIVPDQSFVGTPAAGEKSYAEILRMKKAGATEEQMLERIALEKKPYSLTTSELRVLRDSGVSARVIEAMMRSGRSPLTPASGGGASGGAPPATPTVSP
jgi:hypothetical protein